MGDLTNDFSWSWSRHQNFQTCLRRYWLSHYGFWGGWERNIDPSVREIYLQKRLSSRPQWIGIRVHETAEWVLGEVRRGRFPTPDTVVSRARQLSLRQVGDSRDERYRLNPKKYPGFVEHYYGVEEPAAVWDEAVAEIVRQVEGLFTNPVFLRMTDVPARIREVEQLEQVVVDDIPVWVSLDVLLDDGQGGLVVVDWKTGKAHESSKVAKQLGIYGLYVLSRYLGTPPGSAGPRPVDRVKAMYVNLREGTWEVFDLQDEQIDAAEAQVRSSAADMRALLRDPAKNVADEANFPLIPEGDSECGYCPFRRTCGRE